jgi:hypothetical protein
MPVTISGTAGITYPAGGLANTAGAGVGTTDTQTLTNKTLTTPNINSAQVDTVSGTAPLYMARAWVNFNGTGTVAIRASGNVTNITDNGTGNYTVNFTTAMPDASYSICGTVGRGAGFVAPRIIGVGNTNPTASAAQVTTMDDAGNNQDCEFTMVAIIR